MDILSIAKRELDGIESELSVALKSDSNIQREKIIKKVIRDVRKIKERQGA